MYISKVELNINLGEDFFIQGDQKNVTQFKGK